MKTVNFKNIFQKALSAGFALVLAVFLLFSCDTFEEDSMQEASRLEYKNNLTILVNTPAVIDFRTLIKVNSSVYVQMTDELELGTFNHLGNELYKYTPFRGTSGVEIIPFNVYGYGDSSNFLFTDTLSINIVNSLGDSCYFYAKPDIFYVKSDSSARLSLLDNDILCPSSDDISLSVIKQPDHGSVTTANNEVIYTSSGYNGPDEFAYRIKNNDDPTMTSDALVSLNVGDGSCNLKANDDHVQYNLDVPGLMVMVLDNDIVCNDQLNATIVSAPKKGTAVFNANQTITYTAYNVNDAPYVDSLLYQICEGLICDQAKLRLNVYTGSCNDLEAFDDMVDISDTTLIDGVYQINVTENDIWCSGINIKIKKDPDFGSATIEGNQINYRPDPAVVRNDELLYELCNDSALCDQATVFINREN